MNSEPNRRRSCVKLSGISWFHVGVLLVMTPVIFASGCGKPSETQRDNRRLMDAILTAVVIRSPKELSNDKELLNARHEAGKLSKNAFSNLSDAISRAEAGEWAEAEQQLYKLREQMPFPK